MPYEAERILPNAVAFNCDDCNYSWAKWARGRKDCGTPCQNEMDPDLSPADPVTVAR